MVRFDKHQPERDTDNIGVTVTGATNPCVSTSLSISVSSFAQLITLPRCATNTLREAKIHEAPSERPAL
jgi:hypothetical protein